MSKACADRQAIVLVTVRVPRDCKHIPVRRLYALQVFPPRATQNGSRADDRTAVIKRPGQTKYVGTAAVMDLPSMFFGEGDGAMTVRTVQRRFFPPNVPVSCRAVRRIDRNTSLYHFESGVPQHVSTLQDYHREPEQGGRRITFVTKKEIMVAAGKHRSVHVGGTAGTVFHYRIEPVAADILLNFFPMVPSADPATYDVVYHGTRGGDTFHSIMRKGLQPSSGTEPGANGSRNMMGPGVYTGQWNKAVRFAMFDASQSFHTHAMPGVLLRCIVNLNGAKVFTYPVDHVESLPLCGCAQCRDLPRTAKADRHRHVTDHEGVWRGHYDIIAIPPHPTLTKQPEWVIADPARVTVLSWMRVNRVQVKAPTEVTRESDMYAAKLVEDDGCGIADRLQGGWYALT